MLEVGMKAPEFTLQDKDGNLKSLKDYLGKKVVVYFYPKDNTSGCTKQACAFGAVYNEFKKLGVEVIGISKDTSKSHNNFATKFELPFVLLADPERTTLSEYDVIKEKMMYGKKTLGTERTTFIIDENGMIEKIMKKVKPEINPQEVLQYLMNN